MKNRGLIIGFLSLLVVAQIVSGPTGAQIGRYTEDFTTKQYCDSIATTALWDTGIGELRLPPFEPAVAGTCSTGYDASCLAVDGGIAYLTGEGYGLFAVDISDPANPAVIGSCNIASSDILGIAIAGDYAFAADFSTGLRVIDIGDPTVPSLAATLGCSPPRGIAVAGNYAYLATSADLTVIDISNPTSPSLAAVLPDIDDGRHVTIDGDFAFVSDGAYGLRVVDISDPTSPVLETTHDTPGEANGTALHGDYLLLADGDFGLRVINITDPTVPVFENSVDTPGSALAVAAELDHAYIADGTGGLQVIDIDDVSGLTILHACDTPGSARDVDLAGDIAFVADDAGGLQIIDIADLTSLILTGSYNVTIYEDADILVRGDYAYIGMGYLHVYDISDPANLTEIGSCSMTFGSGRGIAIAGDYAYLASGTGGFQVIDISNPAAPSRVDTVLTGYNTYDVALSGNYVYVTALGYGIYVIDVSDPTAPVFASRLPMYYAHKVAAAGDYLYVADYNYGLRVVDISDPLSLSTVAGCELPGSSKNIAVSGDYAFIANWNNGLKVVDISDPTNPSVAGTYAAPGFVNDVFVSGNFAYIAIYDYGLYVLDISDPTNPILVDNLNTTGNEVIVTASGDYVFLGTYWPDGRFHAVQVMQRALNPAGDEGRSLVVNPPDEEVLWVKLTSSQTSSVYWEVSADSGANWQPVDPDAAWNLVDHAGDELLWRSQHDYSPDIPDFNPTCTSLEIEWLSSSPVVDSIVDVPNDQGRQVSIAWTRSGYDYLGSPTPITGYVIYRRIDYTLASVPFQPSALRGDGPAAAGDEAESLAYPPGDWHYVATVPSRCEWSYATVVPTLADSTIVEGMYQTTFFVSATTASPGIYFDSDPDSGYSVDNLAPHVPTGLMVHHVSGVGNELAWDECADADFQYFRIYRSETENFDPGLEDLVHMTTETEWLDTAPEAWRYHYKITAVDFSGNESDPGSVESVTGDVVDELPRAFALHQNAPNPFNPSTVIRLDLPRRTHVRLDVYDVSGRLVRVLHDGVMEAGRREITWDGRDGRGRVASSGIYFYRLDAGDFVQTRKMVLLR